MPGKTEYEVEKILGEEIRDYNFKHTLMVLVKWVGYDEPTWEPIRPIMATCKDLIEEYRASKGIVIHRRKLKHVRARGLTPKKEMNENENESVLSSSMCELSRKKEDITDMTHELPKSSEKKSSIRKESIKEVIKEKEKEKEKHKMDNSIVQEESKVKATASCCKMTVPQPNPQNIENIAKSEINIENTHHDEMKAAEIKNDAIRIQSIKATLAKLHSVIEQLKQKVGDNSISLDSMQISDVGVVEGGDSKLLLLKCTDSSNKVIDVVVPPNQLSVCSAKSVLQLLLSHK